MKLKTNVWTAALAAAMVSIVLALGGVELVVSRTNVSPEAIELSVIHADYAVERAWKLPAAASFRHEVSWQPVQSSQRVSFVRRACRKREVRFGRNGPLLDWLLHNGPDLR
jgi:hypothetical protein